MRDKSVNYFLRLMRDDNFKLQTVFNTTMIKLKPLAFPLFFCYFFLLPVQAKDNSEVLLEVFQRIDSLSQEIRILRGENEQLQHTIENLKKAQKNGFLGMDDRMDVLSKQIKLAKEKSVQSASSKEDKTQKKAPPQKVNEAIKPDTIKKPEKVTNIEKKEIATDKPTQNTTGTVGKNTENSKTHQNKVREASKNEKVSYQQAYKKINAKPAIAIQAFRNYIKEYSDSPLAANAQYWIGEVMYSQKNYTGAVDEFVKVLQNYRKSDKASDAAIKLGFSFYELKNWVYARRALEDVNRYFPKTKAAALARQRIIKMKADGHY
jgi:tol-pal system protein YbgF